MKKKIFLVALAALALIGCEKPQSELDFAEVKSANTASITGVVSYNPGVSKAIPAAGVEVIALVQNSVYNSAISTGEMQFKATTDSLGQYTVSVPCPSTGMLSTAIRLVTAPLQADFTDASTGETSKVWYNVKGNGKNPAKDLIAGSVEIVDLELQPEIRFKDYIGKATISGTVTYEAGAVKSGSEWVIDNAPYVGALKASVVYNAYTADEFTEEFELSTDAEGKYTLELPAGDAAINIDFLTALFEADYTDVSDITKPEVKKATFVPESFSYAGIVKDKIYTCDHNIAHDPALDEDDDARDYIVKINGVAKSYGEVIKEGKVEVEDAFRAFDVVVTVMSTSGTDNRQLAFETKASANDGSYSINANLFNSWEDGFEVKVDVKEIMPAQLKHNYRHYSGVFDEAKFKTKDYWDWYGDALDSLWAFSWKTQQLEGYYPAASTGYWDVASAKEIRYKEFKADDIYVVFVPKEPEKAMGLSYETRNDEDADGNYSPIKITVADKDGIDRELTHNKYTYPGSYVPWY